MLNFPHNGVTLLKAPLNDRRSEFFPIPQGIGPGGEEPSFKLKTNYYPVWVQNSTSELVDTTNELDKLVAKNVKMAEQTGRYC